METQIKDGNSWFQLYTSRLQRGRKVEVCVTPPLRKVTPLFDGSTTTKHAPPQQTAGR